MATRTQERGKSKALGTDALRLGARTDKATILPTGEENLREQVVALPHRISGVPATQDFLAHLLRNAPTDIVQLHTSMQYGDESKFVTVTFDPEKYPKRIELLMLTDVQWGHLLCLENKFIEFRDWVLDKPYRFVFFGGDMVDAAHALSIASCYENKYEPQAQVYRFVEAAMPLRHRVLGYVGGNHERRSSKTFGDMGHLIAALLKIPYSSGKQLIDINYGDHKPFKVSLWHGGTGSRTKGAKAQMLHRFMAQGDSHLYLVGHLHDVVVLFDWRERREGRRIVLDKFAGAMSSSFLEYWGGYGEVAGMAPTDTMMARVILEPDRHWELTLK